MCGKLNIFHLRKKKCSSVLKAPINGGGDLLFGGQKDKNFFSPLFAGRKHGENTEKLFFSPPLIISRFAFLPFYAYLLNACDGLRRRHDARECVRRRRSDTSSYVLTMRV